MEPFAGSPGSPPEAAVAGEPEALGEAEALVPGDPEADGDGDCSAAETAVSVQTPKSNGARRAITAGSNQRRRPSIGESNIADAQLRRPGRVLPGLPGIAPGRLLLCSIYMRWQNPGPVRELLATARRWLDWRSAYRG